MSHIAEKRKVGDLLKEEIVKALIEPSYYTDVNETLKGRKCWRISGHVFESLSKILLACSGGLSFAAGVYDDKILSFVAGTLSTVSLATFQFSLYSMKMHKKNSLELNQLLEKLEIEGIPIYESQRRENGTEIVDDYTEPTMMCRNVDDKQYTKVEVKEEQIITEAYKIETPGKKEIIEKPEKEIEIEMQDLKNGILF